MEKNLKDFLIKLAVFALLLFAIRAIFQFPIEFFRIKLVYESTLTRVFSKGDAMKVIAFAGVCFFLAFRNKLEMLSHAKINWKNSGVFFAGSLIFVAAYYYLNYVTNLNGISSGIALYLILAGKFASLAFSGFLLFLSVFQTQYAKSLWKYLGKELTITGILMVVFYFILMIFQAQWRFFSGIVAEVLIASFTPFYDVTALRGGASGTVLTVDNFTIAIAAPCSGIDSMLLFSALFGVIFALDHKNLNKGQYALMFVIGLIGDFMVNNLRLFLLILVGVHISPKIAVGLFHTHAGWILFLGYFMAFYWLVNKLIYKKNIHVKK